MYQPPVRFQRFVAIDWSGAEKLRRAPIQVAEYLPATGNVGLVPPLRGNRWDRTSVVDYVRQTVNAVEEGPALIGFDFAFAYPYCDQDDSNQRAYFPGVNVAAPPQNPRALWAEVEKRCKGIGNFYGAHFFRNPHSPYRQYHRYPKFRPTDHYEERLRMTERVAKNNGLQPCSVFKCIGPKQVGTGSVAGMRVLHEFRRKVLARDMALISIWPFDANGVPDRSTVVEIYPRLFLRHAERHGIRSDPKNIQALCCHFGSRLRDRPVPATKDQRDALVSAAGMGSFTQRGAVAWQVPACAANHEGWIFGVQVQAHAP